MINGDMGGASYLNPYPIMAADFCDTVGVNNATGALDCDRIDLDALLLGGCWCHECLPVNPCRHGGVCVNYQKQGYTCDCEGDTAGLSGPRVEARLCVGRHRLWPSQVQHRTRRWPAFSWGLLALGRDSVVLPGTGYLGDHCHAPATPVPSTPPPSPSPRLPARASEAALSTTTLIAILIGGGAACFIGGGLLFARWRALWLSETTTTSSSRKTHPCCPPVTKDTYTDEVHPFDA